jgi:3-oxoacyl-[acyl-carrier-protein] synthase II
VVITGFGAVTSLGHAVGIETPDKTLPSMANALLEARNGFSEATLFATAEIPVKKAAEVSDLEDALDRKALKQLGRGQQLGVLAAEYAKIDAGGDQGHYDPYRFGAWVGTDFGAISLKQWGTIWENVSDQDRHLVNQKFTPTIVNGWTPTWVLKSMTNGCQSHIAIRHQMLGEGSTNSQACAASTFAIGSALRSIQYGQCDACIAGGTSATVIDFFVAGFLPLTTMSESGNHRPYDKARDGFILGEGAAFLILEEEVMARQRGARCYARLRGFATRGDGFNITAPSVAGSAATIKAALEDAEVDPDEVG